MVDGESVEGRARERARLDGSWGGPNNGLVT